MSPNLVIYFEQGDLERITAFLKGVANRLNGPTARSQLLPILIEHLQPIVAREREILDPHNKSRALSDSLTPRSGSGDRPGTVSAFSAPTATNAQLQESWGLRGRMQQKGWAANLKPTKTRKKVFYGTILHQGHAIMKKGEQVGFVDPVPFASDAVEALGDAAVEAAAEAIIDYVMGGEKSST